MLLLKQVDFSYSKKKLFTNLNLNLADHKVTTIIGPNGSGKSTLFKLFTRAVKPANGTVMLDNNDIWQLDRKTFAKKVAIVHQQNPLYDEITVKDLIKMGRLPYQSILNGGEAKDKQVDRYLAQLDLMPLKDKKVSLLSGGQQQRTWLAVALAQEPDYLFLDEPTTYLDLHFQYQFLQLIRQLNRKQGLTICMILHDLNQALQFSDQVVLLNQGKVIKQGAADSVITPELVSENFQINCELIKTEKGNFLRQY